MEIGEYKKMYDLETTYWWYVGRRYILRSLIRKYLDHKNAPVVDIGCGTGANLSLLQEFSENVVGLDKSPQAIEYCRIRGFKNSRIVEDASNTDVEDNSTRLVTMLDVLEHVEAETKTLKEIHRMLSSGGILLITVPAYQFLWSEHDVSLHHKRRYTKKQLISLLENSGYSILKSTYAITFSFPIIVLYRMTKGMFNSFYQKMPKTSHVQLPKFLNDFFILLLKTEGLLIKSFNFPFGTSVVVVARANK